MRHRIHLALATVLGLGVAGVGVSAVAEATPWTSRGPAHAVIRDVQGTRVGNLRIEGEGFGKSRVTVNLQRLPGGYHGFHIHATGVCEPKALDPATGSPFFSSGGHFDLGMNREHGDHSGDLPPILVGADGTGAASFITDRFRVAQLDDGDGSAIVIHELPDNFANIPARYTHPADATGTSGAGAATRKAGDSGARIACGVIR